MRLRAPTVDGLRRQKERHRARGPLYRVIFAAAGFIIFLGGVLLLVLPGPGLLLIAVGLGMLALEFAWAEKALEFALSRLQRASERVKRRRAGGEKSARDEALDETRA